MAFIPNIHFSVWIKIEGRLREFNFRKRTEDVYDTDTADDRGNRWQFKWTRGADGWEIVSLNPGLPTWIVNNKAVIEESFSKQPEVK